MACSKYELGYEDNRFEIVVSQGFHCPICFMVLKDPVMCKNQHHYCSFCIKKYLENSAFCPTGLEYLSVDTLNQAPRIVKDYISELNIHCDFHPRGCSEMVQVGDLKRHVARCGFSPVQCSNDGCNVLVNVRDKLHHEAGVCGFRKLKCHDCGQLKNEVKEMKVEMLVRQDQIKNEMKGTKNEMKGMVEREVKGMKGEMLASQDQVKNEMKEEMKLTKNEIQGIIENEMKGMKDEIENRVKEGMKGMMDHALARQGQMQDKIWNEIKEEAKDQMKYEMKGMKNEVRNMKVEIKNEMKVMIENEMKEMKVEMKNEIKGMKVEMKSEMRRIKMEMKNEMKEIVMNGVRDAMVGIKNLEVEMKDSKQSSQATCTSHARENIFVAGGQHFEGRRFVMNQSTECFNWVDQTWTLLNAAVFRSRSIAGSFLYQDQMVVAGGQYDGGRKTNTLKCLNVADPAATWKDFAVNLPVKCSSHKVVNCKDRLFMSGGVVQGTGGQIAYSDAVYEVQLVPPYRSKMLTRLSQPRYDHGMEMFDQKLFILGGYAGNVTDSVVQCDLIKHESKKMRPLPYAVCEMATVLWRNNVLVIGGMDTRGSCLKRVVMYDVMTGRSQMLPCMTRKRYGCTAVLTGNVVVVMGGRNENDKYLKSVECFDLERQLWQDLPDMLEPRAYATAVVRPNH